VHRDCQITSKFLPLIPSSPRRRLYEPEATGGGESSFLKKSPQKRINKNAYTLNSAWLGIVGLDITEEAYVTSLCQLNWINLPR